MDSLRRCLFLGHDRLTGALAGTGNDLDHAPALRRRQRTRLDDAHGVTDAGLVVLVVRLELGRQTDDALVERMARQALDGHDDRLVHLVRHDPADLLLVQCGALLDGAHSSSPLAALAAVLVRVELLVAVLAVLLAAVSFLAVAFAAGLAAARAAGFG